MKQCQNIKQNWAGGRNFSIYFLRFHHQASLKCKNGQSLKLLIEIFRQKHIVSIVILAFLNHLKPRIFFIGQP